MKKNKTYFIYEVPGVKIGCTTNPKHRIEEEQGFHNWIILEEHTDIVLASEREIQLQKEKGYKVDSRPYSMSVNNRYKFTDAERQNAYKTDGARRGGITQGTNCRDQQIGIFDPIKRKEYQLLRANAGTKVANARTVICPDGHITTPTGYKQYCKSRGLDPTLATKITN